MFDRLLIALVLMASGRAMTLAFIGRAGDGGPGDPPAAWLMPLVGDAAIGLMALVIAWLIWQRPSAGVWLGALVWTAIGAFDALAALLVEVQSPWPDFFMLKIFGRSMFIAAVILHLAILWLLRKPSVMARFGLAPGLGSTTPLQLGRTLIAD